MKIKLLFGFLLTSAIISAQLNIVNLGQTYQIDFDNTTSGVVNGPFQGKGFQAPAPSNGIDSRGIRYTGLSTSPQNLSFGGTAVSGEAARQVSNGENGNMNGGSTGDRIGFYAYNTNNSFILNADYCLGWFSDGNVCLAPGEIILKIDNTTGSTINVVRFAYEGKHLNKHNGYSQVNVTYSFDDTTYMTFPGNVLDFTSDNSFAPLEPSWQTEGRAVNLTGLNWASGTSMYIKWTTNYVTSSGFADVLGIDDITIRTYNADYVHDGSWSPSAPTGSLTSSSALILPNATGDTAGISGSTTLQDLYIESGAKLDIADDLIVQNKIYLYADGNGYAQVKGDISGSATYQTYRTASEGKWFNMAIPVDATYDDLTGIKVQTTANPMQTNLWYYDADTPSTGVDGTWRAVPDKASAETEYEAYQLYGGDGTFFGSGPFTMEIEGDIIAPPATVDVSGVGGAPGRFNLVPNPFASAINWSGLRTNNTGELGPTYYIHDGDPDSATVRFAEYTMNMPGSGKYGADNAIPPGQAFFVLVDPGTDGSIDYPGGIQNLLEEPTLYSSTVAQGLLNLRVVHNQHYYDDNTNLFFGVNYNDKYSIEEDGAKMMNSGYPNMYTKSSDDIKLTFNGMSDAWTVKDVAVYFQGDKPGDYTMTIAADGLPKAWTVVLEDKFTGAKTDLRKGTYTFNHSTGASKDRFIVHFNKTGAIGLDEFYGSDIYSYVDEDILTIDLAEVEDANIKIVDMSGKVVSSLTNQSGQAVVNMRDWAKGVYIINVESNGKEVYSNKLVN